MAFLAHGIKQSRSNKILHPGQQTLKLVENLSTSQCEFEAIRRPNQQIILKHRACALEGPAHGRLAEEQAGCAAVMLFSSAMAANVISRFKSAWRNFSRNLLN